MANFNPDVYISEEELSTRISELGLAITNDYAGEELVVICVLKGGQFLPDFELFLRAYVNLLVFNSSIAQSHRSDASGRAH